MPKISRVVLISIAKAGNLKQKGAFTNLSTLVPLRSA